MSEPSAPGKTHSLYWQITTLFALFTAFAFCLLFLFFQITEKSTGKGGAINIAGSLRMQTYVMAFTVARSSPHTFDTRKEAIEKAVNEFENRLLNPGLAGEVPQDKSDSLRKTYDQIYQDFYFSIKPAALAVIEDPSVEQKFLNLVPPFVHKVDRFVFDLEKDLEVKTKFIEAGLMVSMPISLLFWFCVQRYLRRRLFEPLGELTRLAQEVREGNFSVSSSYKQKNEIGLLSESLNFMTHDLERMYSSLEDQVREKTAHLDRKNRMLDLLYRLKNFFAAPELKRGELKDALNFVRTQLDARGVSLYIAGSASERARLAESSGTVPTLEPEEIGKDSLLASENPEKQKLPQGLPAEVRTEFSSETARAVQGETTVRLIFFFKGAHSDTTDANFLANIAREFALALENNRKSSESRRFVLYEERSTIARELHDSIAQSLAFSRIQLTLLGKALEGEPNPDKARSILKELKHGIQTAYAQLRSVLTTFRLKPESPNLNENIAASLDEFSARSGIRYQLTNRLQSFEIDANRHVHLLHILREALANVEKHSRASRVEVSLLPSEDGSFRLTVKDNGIGFDSARKEGHFGISIMQERAHAMGGVIEIKKAEPHGTEVALNFDPSGPSEG